MRRSDGLMSSDTSATVRGDSRCASSAVRSSLARRCFRLPLAAGRGQAGRVKLGKLSATAPADWKSEKPANLLRTYQFKLPGAKDHPTAELTVMAESHAERGEELPQVEGASSCRRRGRRSTTSARRAKWDVQGATVNVLDVTGTWKYKERPLDPKSKEMLLDDYARDLGDRGGEGRGDATSASAARR